MTLNDIIKSGAARMSGVTVKFNHSQSTVCISDDEGVQEDIFLQGDDADGFISRLMSTWHAAQHVTQDEGALHMAEEYTSCIWS